MLTLATQAYAANSREFRVLAALLRNGALALPKAAPEALRELALGRPGPLLGEVLHSQLTLEALGFSYSEDVILNLSWLSRVQLHDIHRNIETMLKRALGAHQVFRPMYPNFPEQVLAASDMELLVNAWMHYLGDWFGVRILPDYTEAKRPPLKLLEHQKPTALRLAEGTAVYDLLVRLVNGNASMSPTNRELVLDLLSYAAEFYPGRLLEVLTERATLPQKETRALVGGWLLKHQSAVFDSADMARFFGTPTDVLRLAVAVSAADLKVADVSLAAPPRFNKVSRSTRRWLLAQLNSLDALSVRAEMFQRREPWVRLGEFLHPGEYQTRYPQAYAHFQALRNNDKPETWHGAMEASLVARETGKTLELLTQRPGVFARKLHEVVRKTHPLARADVVSAFLAVAHKVSTPVLLQLQQRMQLDLARVGVRAFAPKGGAKLWVPQQAASFLPSSLTEPILAVVTHVLRARFAKLPPLGKVYIDPALKGYTVPFGQRSAQKALRTVGRGSRVALGDGNIVRAFMWWSETGLNKEGHPYTVPRTDLDLSCAMLDESFDYLGHCSFTRLRTPGLTHSGDVTSAPTGACEFIDIDFSALPKKTAYIALVTYAYTRQNFGDLPEAYLGWMARSDGQSGAIFDARTVSQKVDLTATGARVLVGYIDVARREFVWADLVLPDRCAGFNAIESSTLMTGVLARGIVNPIRPQLYELAFHHAMARGELVFRAEEADVVFTSRPHLAVATAKQVISAYDAEIIMADFLQ